MTYLLDTNVISEIIRKKPDRNVLTWLNNIPEETLFISVLTIGEIRKGIEKHPDTKIREQLRFWLETDLQIRFGKRKLPINEKVADRWGKLLAEAKKPLPVIDSLIAATALHYDLRIVTRNQKDFYYPDLDIINPWE
jgi:toxin FitB